MNRRRTLLLCLGAIGALASCREEQHAQTPTPRPVLTVVANPEASRSMSFAGTIGPRYASDLGFRVLGRIDHRDVGLGDVVQKGQRLAMLDAFSYQVAVQAAEADLAGAAAHLENVAATEARLRTLLAQKVTTQAQFDAAAQERESAAAAVTRAQANLDKARQQLGYTQLSAEFDGVVTAVQAELGEVVQPGQTVMTLASPDIREAVVDVPESIGGTLRPGAPFDVALQVDPSDRVAGTVREIAPRADSSTRTLRVRIALDQPRKAFRIGTTITATAHLPSAPGVELPASALREQDGKTTVWVVDPSAMTVSARTVTVAARGDATVRVIGNLTAGTRIVAAGVHSLSQGQSIALSDGAL